MLVLNKLVLSCTFSYLIPVLFQYFWQKAIYKQIVAVLAHDFNILFTYYCVRSAQQISAVVAAVRSAIRKGK